MKTYDIPIQINNTIKQAQLHYDRNYLKFTGHNIELIDTEEQVHTALDNIRTKLEEQNILLLINASRIDTFPSGMQRSMNIATAYIHTFGKPSLSENIVVIFEPTNDLSKIATIAQQKEWRKNYINDFKNRPPSINS